MKSILGEEVKSILFENLNEPPFADVTFVLDSGARARAHKAIIACRCRELATLISTYGTSEVPLSGFSFDAFTNFLGFLYSDSIGTFNEKIEGELLKLATKFCVPRLTALYSGKLPGSSTITDDYKNALVDKKFTDFTLLVHGQPMAVHKVFLAARCKYFHSMLMR